MFLVRWVAIAPDLRDFPVPCAPSKQLPIVITELLGLVHIYAVKFISTPMIR